MHGHHVMRLISEHPMLAEYIRITSSHLWPSQQFYSPRSKMINLVEKEEVILLGYGVSCTIGVASFQASYPIEIRELGANSRSSALIYWLTILQ